MDFNTLELQKQSDELKSKLTLYETYGEPTIQKYTAELDSKVAAIRLYLNSCKEYNLNFDVPSLQRMCMDLSSTIYYVNEGIEQVALLEDMANIAYKSKYNEAYTTLQGGAKLEDRKYTTDQLRALAEQEALTERLICFIYAHAASVIKGKVDSAYELLKATSKSLSAEIQAMSTYGVGNKFNS